MILSSTHCQMNIQKLIFFVFLILAHSMAFAGDLAGLIEDRLAMDAVYDSHRLGQRGPAETTELEARSKASVQLDLQKEAVLKNIYAFTISPAIVEAEVKRINRTTRAPEMLAEIKTALGDDPIRFARSMARPIVAERELRRRFVSDDSLHVQQRAEAEKCRAALLAKEKVAEMHEATWLLSPRPEETAEANPTAGQTLPTEVKAKSALYTVEATAQIAQVLGAPAERDETMYFEDIDPELGRVLKAQLLEAGDTSAVIETNSGFLVFQAKEITDEIMTVVSKNIPKRSYEEWLRSNPSK